MKTIFTVLIFVSLYCTQVFADDDDIVGIWLTEGGKGRIKIYKCGDNYCGRTTWINKSEYPNPNAQKDVKNPNPLKRNRKLIGLTIMWGLKYKGDNKWQGGTIYDPQYGKTFKCKTTLIDDGDTLKFRGYVGFALLGITAKWKRVKQ